jgi:DNA-binding NtrC family response regulator
MTTALPGTRPPSTAARTVLIVDDETRLREMLTTAVGEMGFAVTPARSAETAMKLIEAQSYDIVILDLNLPGMSGMEFFEILRQKMPEGQVIILTGFGTLESARRAIRLDVSDFLTKPCALGELEVALERARQKRLAVWTPEKVELPPQVLSQPGMTIEELERRHILATLERNNGNRSATANELGISLRTLYYRLGAYQRQGLMGQG